MIRQPRKLRSPLKWHGGKSYLCRRFLGLFPGHDTYIEPFAGGLSTLLNKPRSTREIVSDLNCDLMATWVAIRDHADAIAHKLGQVSYSGETFLSAKAADATGSDVDLACAFLIRNRMSRGGLGEDFAWSERLRGGKPGDVNSWETFLVVVLPMVAERIRDVEFRNTDAIATISDAAPGQRTLIYADPPYLHETRSHRASYAHEMTKEDHARLLDVLRGSKARVFLSGYRSSLYDAALQGWTRHEFDMPNHSGQGKDKQRRTECLWENR